MAVAGFVANGGQCIAALVLVVIPTESVPPQFTATAIGLATMVGEIVGGVLAPLFSGLIVGFYSLGVSLWIAAAGAILACLAGLFMRETAPSRKNRQT
jgi:hypothetical protein